MLYLTEAREISIMVEQMKDIFRLDSDPSAIAEHSIESKKVAILVCTYNGERFLREQLESFINQTHKNWSIHVSDDGSTDATLEILEEYKKQLGDEKIVILQGPRQGFAKNFLSLIKNREIVADYFAFSDQDDIWLEDKLSRSIAQIPQTPTIKPHLYCSRTKLVNTDLAPLGFSPLFKKRPCFENSLVQSIAGANTMMINNAARDLMCRIADDALVVAHDWLAYLLVTGCGGQVVFDQNPTLLYRQHEGNLIGANATYKNQVNRILKMLSGRFSEWSTQNLIVLNSIRMELTEDNRRTLERFEAARNSGLLSRLYLMKKSGVHRQTLKGNISLVAAAILNKI